MSSIIDNQADKTQRAKLLAKLRETSDKELEERRFVDPTLSDLTTIDTLFRQKRIQARCYTAKKFHAKAYFATRVHYSNRMGILGSGNFTGPGLTRNIELNVELSPEQTTALGAWFEERWKEAAADDVTADIHIEIKRHIDLYDPYAIYQCALLAWGDWIQGRDELPPLELTAVLDPHQEDAYRQALKIIARERGVLISDGVGLGKSYVALALMEHFLARGKRAFLIAPKAVITSSWEGYLTKYLDRYRRGYSSLVHEPMTRSSPGSSHRIARRYRARRTPRVARAGFASTFQSAGFGSAPICRTDTGGGQTRAFVKRRSSRFLYRWSLSM